MQKFIGILFTFLGSGVFATPGVQGVGEAWHDAAFRAKFFSPED
jgi:hypothetical protein